MRPLKKGFTLFELIIVVFIIGTAYYLVVPYFHKNEIKKFEFHHLKEYLLSFSSEENIKLVCIEDCKKCYVIIGNKKTLSPVIASPLTAYHYEKGHLEEVEFPSSKYFDLREKVCFSYSVNAQKKIGEELFVKYDNKIYYFSPYFKETFIFDNLSKAKDFYEKLLNKLKDTV